MKNNDKKVIKLDLTGCKTWWDYHERIRVAFDFPEWYGKNWSAFWDLLRTCYDVGKVEIIGEHTLKKEFNEYIKMTHEIFDDNIIHQAKFGEKFEYEVIDQHIYASLIFVTYDHYETFYEII